MNMAETESTGQYIVITTYLQSFIANLNFETNYIITENGFYLEVA